MSGDAGDVDATGAVLDEERDEQAPQEDRVDVEDVDGEDARGLGLEELRPGSVGALRCWIDPCLLQDLPNGGGGVLPSQVEQFDMDPAIPVGLVKSLLQVAARVHDPSPVAGMPHQ